jgi:hypothetical protein
MGIPNLIRYEAQIARTGRAKCRICGNLVSSGSHILKVLGFRINQSLHPECVANLALSLAGVLKEMKDNRDYVLRAFDGVIKVGFYSTTDDPKKRRFTTLKLVKLAVQPERKEDVK